MKIKNIRTWHDKNKLTFFGQSRQPPVPYTKRLNNFIFERDFGQAVCLFVCLIEFNDASTPNGSLASNKVLL